MARIHLDILIRPGALIAAFSASALAQISPGPLFRGHEALEGVTACTQCHDRGAEISTDKCLSCHSEIAFLLQSKHGMHALTAARKCNECHKEHLGRDAAITRFTPSNFDHGETGFRLTGKHSGLTCARCHEQTLFRVENKALPRSPSRATYLGLRTECSSCHEDRHEATVGKKCAACHSTSGWSPAGGLDHAVTAFPLTGKHGQVRCSQCHESLGRSPRPRVLTFKRDEFADCSSCHRSSHTPAFLRNRLCRDCHTTGGWESTEGFNHDVTQFPLTGKHRNVECEQCHTGMAGRGRKKPADFSTKPFADCRSCHKSPHSMSLNRNVCSTCHNTAGWRMVENNRFDHSQTAFPLAGRHSAVTCNACHQSAENRSLAVRWHGKQQCSTCHPDHHEGVFAKRYADCSDCHNENGFVPSLFGSTAHERGRFPLIGAHRAVLCKDCHRKEGEKSSFVFRSVECIACHTDVHNGAFNALAGTRGCATCHDSLSWKTPAYVHKRFSPVGRHRFVSCSGCHSVKGGALRYENTPTTCAACHEDPHGGQFRLKGATSCETCHTPESWRLLIFDHEVQSTFKLSGAHARISCGACHRSEKTGGVEVVRYKPLRQSCEACHQEKTR